MKNMFKIGICLLIAMCDQGGMNAGFRNLKAFTALAKMRLQPSLRAKMLGGTAIAAGVGAGVTAAGAQDGQKQQANGITSVKITTDRYGLVNSLNEVQSPFYASKILAQGSWDKVYPFSGCEKFIDGRGKGLGVQWLGNRTWKSWFFNTEIERAGGDFSLKVPVSEGAPTLNIKPSLDSGKTVSSLALRLGGLGTCLVYSLLPEDVLNGTTTEKPYKAIVVEIPGHYRNNDTEEVLETDFVETGSNGTKKFGVKVTRQTRATCEERMHWISPKISSSDQLNDLMKKCQKPEIKLHGLREDELHILDQEVIR